MASAAFSEADSELIATLQKLSKASPKLIKSSTYPTPADPHIVVQSWKMDEFRYHDVPSPFPTLARGLFSVELPKNGARKKYRIVARGYDKFFNIGEVPWCTWPALEAHTAAPYVLSLKSNGCIIFIAALTDSKLLITSKHSVGPIQGSPVSHAEAGEQWLRKYLQEKDRTEDQLATCLWENNWTAVAELCDDSFEEHVLGYPPEKTGLHLHGINESTKTFRTLPQASVDAFAAEWGFIQTASITLDSIAAVEAFTSDCSKTGQWNGEATEGFVIRTHVTTPPRGKGNRKSVEESPYEAGSSFFFKVKFDEPYMMYRDWRELTKMILSSKGNASLSVRKLPKAKLKRPETQVYVKWVVGEIGRDRTLFEQYTKGKGIIETRERFLRWMETEEGLEMLEKAKKGKLSLGYDAGRAFGKTIILPVAVPGCGKTAVAVALAHLFGFAHTQSDDVQAKKAAPKFLKNVTSLLHKNDVVIADKNNHLREHRRALRQHTHKFSPPVRLLALHWSITDKPSATVHQICGERVQARGMNHQTLHADVSRVGSGSGTKYGEVIWSFINSTEALREGEVDAVVDMEVEEDLEAAVRRAVVGCVDVLGVEMPSEEKIGKALEVVMAYAPAMMGEVVEWDKPKSEDKKRSPSAGVDVVVGEKKFTPRYYALQLEMDLQDMLGEKLSVLGSDSEVNVNEASVQAALVWERLKAAGRISNRPHITIVHQNSMPKEAELWNLCAALHALEEPPLFKAMLGTLVWNERVLAITVEQLEVVPEEDEDGEWRGKVPRLARELLEMVDGKVGKWLHVTVGTRQQNVPAVEARDLVGAFRREGAPESGGLEGYASFKLDDIVVYGRVRGLY